jgi:hypothetical protein
MDRIIKKKNKKNTKRSMLDMEENIEIDLDSKTQIFRKDNNF